MRANDEATFVVCTLATHTLLHQLENANELDRYPCHGVPIPNSSIHLGGGPLDTIRKLYDWPSIVLDKALRAMHDDLKVSQEAKVKKAPQLALPTENSVSSLFIIFQTFKTKSKYAAILANMAVAAMGLRYAIEVSTIHLLCPPPSLMPK